MNRTPLLRSTGRAIGWSGRGPIDATAFLGDVYRLAERLPSCSGILNVCEDRYRFLVVLAAGLVTGRPNLLPPSTAPQALKQIAADRGDLVCLTDGVAVPEGGRCIHFREPPGSGTPCDSIPAFPDDQVMAEVFTSGSTGQPTPHQKRWGEMLTGAALTGRRFGLDAAEAGGIVATVPAQHMFGLETSIMLALRWGLGTHTGRPFFPRNVAETLNEVPEPRILVTTPLHIRACLTEGVLLPNLHFILSATAPLSAEMAVAAEAAFDCPVREIYGSTETGAMATRRTAEGPRWLPIEGFRISRRNGRWQAEADHLDAPVVLGDRLEERPEGTFELLGRDGDLVKIAGKRSSLGDLNHKLLAIDGVKDGTFLIPGEEGDEVLRLAAVVVAPTLTEKELLQELRKHLDPVFLPRPLRLVESLPRNATGKLPRGRLLELLSKD